jgi:hypothetical protein
VRSGLRPVCLVYVAATQLSAVPDVDSRKRAPPSLPTTLFPAHAGAGRWAQATAAAVIALAKKAKAKADKESGGAAKKPRAESPAAA